MGDFAFGRIGVHRPGSALNEGTSAFIGRFSGASGGWALAWARQSALESTIRRPYSLRRFLVMEAGQSALDPGPGEGGAT
jgi:hypothetical protein